MAKSTTLAPAGRRLPDAAILLDQLGGQRPNMRASHAAVLHEMPDGGVGTVAINRRESPLMQMFHGKHIGTDEFTAGCTLRDWFEKSMLAGLKSQGYEIMSTGGWSGERVPSPSAEWHAMAYRQALLGVSVPRLWLSLAIGLTSPGELLHALVAQGQGVRAIEQRWQMRHGEGTRRLVACLGFLWEFLDGRLELKPLMGRRAA